MSTPLSTTLFAWLLTYSIHSTVLLGIAWAVTRRARLDPAASDLLWKVALLAGLVTGTIQSRLAIASHTTVTLHVAAMTPGSRPGSAADTALASGTAGSRPGLATDTALASGTAGSRPRLATDTALASPTPGSRPGLAARWLPLVLVLLWGVIALASCLYYVARRLILVGRLADRRAVADGPLATTLAELQRTTGYRRRVELTMARTISSPVALGLSEICVPELAIELGAEQQRSMLAHELAHLARRDSLWLLSASLIERFFFFQPLNRLARRELETTAEYLSDEWAMRKTGSAVSLAKCLATVAEWIQASPLGVPVAGLAERRSLLVSRIARLLDGKLPASAASRRGWAAVATLAVAATVAAAPHVSSPASPVTVNRVAGADSTSSRVPASGPKSSPSAPVSRAQSSAPGPLSATRREGTATAEQDTTVVKALIARLKDDNASVRAAAAHSLGQLGDARAVLPLIDVLADSDGEVRSNAVDALAELDDPRAIGPISGLLKDPVTDVKRNALDALSHWDQGVPTGPVVALLADPDADVRKDAVQLLDHFHARSTSGAIARLIHDPSADVRSAVVEALGNLGADSEVTAVSEALGDANSDVRQHALSALNDLKAPIADATLINLMKDADPDVRQGAAELAGERSVIAAIPSLRQLIADPKGDVREAATEALGHIADPAARQALQAALQSPDPKVRRAAAEALGQDP